MKVTIVGLVTPHVLQIVDLARDAEMGANVDWHVRDAVAKTVEDLAHQYNARDLLGAYVSGLETAASESGPMRKVYAGVLKAAAAAGRSAIDNLERNGF